MKKTKHLSRSEYADGDNLPIHPSNQQMYKKWVEEDEAKRKNINYMPEAPSYEYFTQLPSYRPQGKHTNLFKMIISYAP